MKATDRVGVREEKSRAKWREGLIIFGPLLGVYAFFVERGDGFGESAILAVGVFLVAFVGMGMCYLIVRWAGGDATPQIPETTSDTFWGGVLFGLSVFIMWQYDSRNDLDLIADCASTQVIASALTDALASGSETFGSAFDSSATLTEARRGIEEMVRRCASQADE